jgi:septal ring factor EnvC (AmiA/AmiB activator)
MKVMKSGQDEKIKRILVACVVLIVICVVCIFVSIRFVDKYRDKAAETASLKQKLDDLEQDIKKLDIKTKELEAMRYDLSLEKRQTSKDYSTIKDKYISLGKTIKTLERDINNLQKAFKMVGVNETDPVIDDEDSSGNESQLRVLQSRNDELLRELAVKTKEKMILKIALESQAKRLGLSEQYDPELKKILKDLVISLQ